MTAKGRAVTRTAPEAADLLPVFIEEPLPPISELPEMPLPDWNDTVELAKMGQALVASWERETLGYERGVSHEVLPAFGETVKIPILDLETVLPRIIDTSVVRVHSEVEKQGPRLLGASPKRIRAGRIAVGEFPPMTVTVQSNDRHFLLPMPYVIEMFSMDHFQMNIALAFQPMTVDHQEIYVPPLPHLDGHGRVCIYEPPGGYDRLRRAEPLEAVCIMMNHFWFTNFRYFNDFTPIMRLGKGDGRNAHAAVIPVFEWWEEQTMDSLQELAGRNKLIRIPGNLQTWAEQQMMGGGYMGSVSHELDWYLSEADQQAADAREQDHYEIKYWNPSKDV